MNTEQYKTKFKHNLPKSFKHKITRKSADNTSSYVNQSELYADKTSKFHTEMVDIKINFNQMQTPFKFSPVGI